MSYPKNNVSISYSASAVIYVTFEGAHADGSYLYKHTVITFKVYLDQDL